MSDNPARAAGFTGQLVVDEAAAPGGAKPDVSVAGVLLLSAGAVLLSILSVVMLGLVVMAGWWLVSHIPVPVAVTHLLHLLHLT